MNDPNKGIVGQLLRFGLVGMAMTLATAGAYVLLVRSGLDPFLSLTLAYAGAMLVAYRAHDRFTFQGHGARSQPAQRFGRFVAVNAVGYALNQGFVWLMVVRAGWPDWTPALPIILVTPLATFALQRRWVFN
ncbi:GtrA family protein [Sandarakinorhabdus rubra]|uniref:GtrA family protein n=1 Tax=Sandarakinorhabdus rubra TaxID=2672568 RepID=UPI0013DCF50B|nr:GtrA family protein [Sandarakinorhabdus rubra]